MLAAFRPRGRCVRIIGQPSVYFGLSMIVLLWIGTINHIETERQANTQVATQETANLSRLFAENVVRSISEIDKILQFLRHSYELSGYRANWTNLVNDIYLGSEITLQLAVIDASGLLVATNLDRTSPRPIDLSDRQHFRVHTTVDQDHLYISVPVMGRRSRRWSVQFTRRFTNADGNFGGVIVASLNPEHFAKFYESINLGPGGAVALIGHDGIVRASGGDRALPLGANLRTSELFKKVATHSEGYVYDSCSKETGTKRVVSFRTVRGLPLVVTVSAELQQPGSSYVRNSYFYFASASLLTVLILIGIWLGVRHGRRLEEAREALASSEARSREKSRQLGLTLEHMSQGIFMVNEEGNIPVINARCLELLGLPIDLMSRNLNYKEMVACLEASGEFSTGAGSVEPDVLDYIFQSVDAEPIAAYERTRPDGTVLEVRSEALPDGGFVRTFNDVTLRRRNEAQIVHLARHDPLTDLANRVLFREELDQALKELGAKHHTFALHLIDLDHFKFVNDTFGHPVGDQLLKDVAKRLQETVRRNDIIARLGGDEFAVLQVGISRDEQAGILADRLCRIIDEPFNIDGVDVHIGASIGVAIAPTDGKSTQDLLKAADLALYAAKGDGRGIYRYFKSEMNASLQARRRLDNDLRAAVAEQQFVLHYQPIRQVAQGQVTGYEALIRWRHPERGLVPPIEFIPAAEESGLIVAIGAWALHTACTEIARLPGTLRIAVNLSPVQFRSPDLVSTVQQALNSSGLAPHRLELEITETALLDKNESTLRQLKALHELGVRIALDDFGSGYSSLSYLMSYPIDCIKIDRSFVASLGAGKQSTSIIRAITDLADNLGMTTTAEGVETVDQLNRLRSLGCYEAQGYYFSRPLPASEAFAGIEHGETKVA